MRFSLSHVLVVSQIAISLLMLVAAGLFVRTLSNLQSIELGFNRENVLLFQLDARKAGHKDPEISVFYGDLQKRFSAIPGVRSASLSQASLITAGTGYRSASTARRPTPATRILFVGPDVLHDHADSDPGRARNRRSRPTRLPAGCGRQRGVRQGQLRRSESAGPAPHPGKPASRDMEIVGVSRNARYGGLKEQCPAGCLHPVQPGLPAAERDGLRAAHGGDPLRYVNTVREIVRQADARVPVTDIRTQAAEIDQTINQEIIFARVVHRLRHSGTGDRLRRSLRHRFLQRRPPHRRDRHSDGARSAARRSGLDGAARGLRAGRSGTCDQRADGVCDFEVSRVFSFRHEAERSVGADLRIGTLLISAMLAGYVPARKASRIDPMIALRHE